MEQFMPARKHGGSRPPSLFRSLCVSMASIVLSLIMLVGTTMAWFSDTTTSAAYTITAGNIDSSGAKVLPAAVSQSEDGSTPWTDLPTEGTTGTPLFSETPYTPNTAQTVCMKLHNDGELPTRYRVSLQLIGDSNALSDKLQYGYNTYDTESDLIAFAGKVAADRAVASAYTGTDCLSNHSLNAYKAQNTTCQVDLEPGAEKFLALSIFMPAEEDTAALSADQTVQVRLTVIATQKAADTVPDAWDGETATATEALQREGEVYLITSPADLAGAAAMLRANAVSNCTLRLTADIDMNSQPWIPIDTNAAVTLDGAGHTIYNLTAGADTNAGLFGSVGSLTASQLTFSGGSAKAVETAGMLAGHADTANLTAVCANNVTVSAASASPLVGSGAVTENACAVSNYTVNP